MSHLGPFKGNIAQIPAKKAVTGIKAGAKRTALGGVVSNSQQESIEEEGKKPGAQRGSTGLNRIC